MNDIDGLSDDHKDRARLRSVDNLQRLYTFVVGLSVAEALRSLLSSPEGQGFGITWEGSLIFISLIVVLIPFYHGANRYLDASYITDEVEVNKSIALLVDFVFLFLQGIVFFAAAVYFESPIYFFWSIFLLLSIDIVWVFLTRVYTSIGPRVEADYFSWGIINGIAIIVIAFVMLTNSIPTLFDKTLFLTIILIFRMVSDYYFVWDFYYPSYFTKS